MRVKTEPALPPGRGERLLLGGELAGRRKDAGGCGWPAEEVDLDLSDQAAAELDVAWAVALVGRRRLSAAHAGCDVLRDDARGGLGEYPGLGDGAAPVATSPSAYTPGNRVVRFVWSTGTQPSRASPDA